MDSSKNIEECSSTESGWTMYIASSPDQDADVEDEDDVDSGEKGCKKKEYVDRDDDVESDDSMASDASSGPSDQGKSCFGYGKSRVFGHAGKEGERKCGVGKKKKLQNDEEVKKVGKDKSGNRGNSAGRSKKV
ncbi:hypothetical protein BUALT_Bualt05G0136000 [Buddleja alternifolia]|uniref:Uncharacterized protein n=1 Tax=Buddleja alternifolia TaxID=168488 RepID=A0AAV6XQP4_9LAMI|nr:hypothetical protein BUALT_Bualt05G0136000 [Buddleja alternifolia]